MACFLSATVAEVKIAESGVLTVEATLSPHGAGLLKLEFFDSDGVATFLRIDVGAARAEFGGTGATGTAEPIRLGGRPHQESDALERAHNYAVEHLPLFSDVLTVKAALKWDAKLAGTLIDCEINALRTMLTYRPDFLPVSCKVTVDGCTLANVGYAPFIEEQA
jgi:hypothetical protein